MGAFRLLVCNIRNSCLPVCRLLPVHTLFQFEQAGHTVRRESGITSTGVQAQEGELQRTPSDSSNISEDETIRREKINRAEGPEVGRDFV